MKETIACLLFLFLFSVKSYASDWMHESKRDPMRDTVSCAVTLVKKKIPSPLIIVFSDNSIITAIAKLYPGKEILVRIDKNKPVSAKGEMSGADAALIFEQIRAGGKQMLFQIQQWPKEAPEYFTADVDNFIEHLDACEKIVKEQ